MNICVFAIIQNIVLCTVSLKWRFKGLKEIQGVSYEKSDGYIRAPSIYYNPPDIIDQYKRSLSMKLKDLVNQKRIKIHCTKYKKGNGNTHLILLAGGPGQSCRVWKEDFSEINRVIQDDFTVYLIEHRGVGKGTGFYKDALQGQEYDESGLEQIRDPSEYSISNVATDVAMLGKMIKWKHRKLHKHKIILMGSSYGGLVVARSVSLFPSIFNWLILDSPSTIKQRFDEKNDDLFLENCQRHSKCSLAIGCPDNFRNIFEMVLNKKKRDGMKRWNKCVELADNHMDIYYDVFNILKGNNSHRNEEHGSPYSMLMVPFILSTFRCSDYKFYKKRILPRVLKIVNKYNQLEHKDQMTSELDFLKNSKTSTNGKNVYEIHSGINKLICNSEIFQFPLGSSEPEICKKETVELTDQCGNYYHYLKHYTKNPSLSYKVDAINDLDNNIETNKTNIVLLVGDIDLITSPVAAVKWFRNHVKAKRKFEIIVPNIGHGVFGSSRCIKGLFDLIMEKVPDLTVFKVCIQKKISLDWSFEKSFKFAKEWWT